MKLYTPIISAAVTAMLCCTLTVMPASANPGIAEGGKKIGHGFKEVFQATGRAFRDSGKAVGRGFKKAGQETGKAFKQMGKEVGASFSGKNKSAD